MSRFVVVSGCSGGGKSTLLAELSQRGYRVVEEPGRRVVMEETARNGTALPWIDLPEFLHRVIKLARSDLRSERASAGLVFFDRGLIDAMLALQHVTGEPSDEILTREAGCYHRQVFLAPPWPEIYVQDDERRHVLDVAVAEYIRLANGYPAFGHDVLTIPKTTVINRTDFVLDVLHANSHRSDH